MASSAASYFAACRAAFDEASRQASGPALRLCVDGREIALRFAGEALAALLGPAFALAPGAPGPAPQLDVVLWDHAEVPVAPPPPGAWPRAADGLDPREPVAIPGFDDPGFRIMLAPDFRLLWMLDRQRGRAVVWARGYRDLPAWELLHPLRNLLHLWLRDGGGYLLHAGAVGDGRGGLLVAGRGGAGKSTTVLAAIAGGLHTAGDDYVALCDRPRPTAHALYATMRLFEEHAARFPGLLPAADHQDLVQGRPKIAAYMGRHRPLALTASLPLVALVAPQVRPQERCALARLTPTQALAALAPSTLQQLRPDPPVLALMQRLCAQLPAWRLTLGTDLQAVPGLLGSLLTAPTAAAP